MYGGGGKLLFSPPNKRLCSTEIREHFINTTESAHATVVCAANGCRKNMLILWTFLITATVAHKVYDSAEDIGPEAFQNVTTLYPISTNTTLNKITNYNSTNDTTNDLVSNDTNSKDDTKKLDATVWKVEAAFAESNLDKNEKENTTTSEDTRDKKNDTKEFRPSPHLGSFNDEEPIQVTPTRASFGSFTPIKNPSSGFVSSTKDKYHSFNQIPKEILQTHKAYPYKFEPPVLTRVKNHWRHEPGPDSLESRPTAEIPVRVPAGGLYKYEDPFKEKPVKEQDDDFGLEFSNDGKDHAVKKRVNPWESLLRLVTAFLPVGLIISALTPSIVTIENTGVGTTGNTYSSNIYRRSEPGEAAELPAISERCRRRLLCELHSEKNYKPQNYPHPSRGKQCYKIHCEDTEGLARSLKWLLEYRQSMPNGRYS